ncbi:MAG: hypothetical protein AB7R00_17955 [Kofleriaceae bacterium]
MTARDDFELMEHADGELEDRLEAGVRARLDRDPNARTKRDGLAQLSEVMRSHFEQAVDEVPERRFEAMWREIDKAIEGGAERSEQAPARVANPAAPGIWARFTSWLDRYRGHLVTGAVSAGAVAALALVLRPGASNDPSSTASSGAIDVRPAALRTPPEIEALDTPGGSGTVMNLEDEDGHAAVIWVTPADIVEGI